jgi:hypothetical protein
MCTPTTGVLYTQICGKTDANYFPIGILCAAHLPAERLLTVTSDDDSPAEVASCDL